MIRLVIKKPDKELKTFLVKDYYLDRLVTNLKLYQKKLDFVLAYREEYEEDRVDSYLPSKSGIVFIDFVNNIILDGQMTTGIGCVTQNEIMMSRNGQIPDETKENSIANRFAELYDDGRLIGFEDWQDNRIDLNTNLNDIDRKMLFDKIKEISGYGQFRFETQPFKIEQHTEKSWFERLSLFNRCKELNLVPVDEHSKWERYLERIKR